MLMPRGVWGVVRHALFLPVKIPSISIFCKLKKIAAAIEIVIHLSKVQLET